MLHGGEIVSTVGDAASSARARLSRQTTASAQTRGAPVGAGRDGGGGGDDDADCDDGLRRQVDEEESGDIAASRVAEEDAGASRVPPARTNALNPTENGPRAATSAHPTDARLTQNSDDGRVALTGLLLGQWETHAALRGIDVTMCDGGALHRGVAQQHFTSRLLLAGDKHVRGSHRDNAPRVGNQHDALAGAQDTDDRDDAIED